MTADALVWVVAVALSAWLRFDTQSSAVPWSSVVAFGLGSAALYVGIGAGIRLHQGRTSLASFSEMVSIGLVALLAGSIGFAVNLYAHWLPRSVPAGRHLHQRGADRHRTRHLALAPGARTTRPALSAAKRACW